MRGILIVLLLFFVTASSFAQELEWQIRLHGFADNQEYSEAGFPAPTNFGTRFSPEIGLRVDSSHRIRIGINSLNEFGDKHRFVRKVDPVIYYQYQKNRLSFHLGAFPRFGNLSDYPRALLRENLQYYRPNMEGFLFSYQGRRLSQQVWVDWTSKQSEVDREGFLIGLSGRYQPTFLYLSHHFTLWHNALTALENPDDHIQDNAALKLSLGADLSRYTFLDSLDLQLGGLVSLDRLRSVYDWRSPGGFLLSAFFGYRSFFIKDVWYLGKPQYIGYGDPFYQFRRYNRLDAGWKPFSNRYLEAGLVVSFHFGDGTFSNQQQLSLRYNIGGRVPLKTSRTKFEAF